MRVFASLGRFLCAALVTLCPASPVLAAEASGQLIVRVKDHREAIGDFQKLEIEIAGIRIKQNPGLKVFSSGWTDLKPPMSRVDLTQYTGNKSALVLSSNVHAGEFEGFELKLNRVQGVLKGESAAIRLKNTLGPIALRFTVSPATVTLLILDLVILDLGDHPPRGYELHLKGYELQQNGKLVEKVPPG